MEMNQHAVNDSGAKIEEDDYMPLDQYQKIMRETESLLIGTENQETYREMSYMIQIATPENSQSNFDLNLSNLYQKNPYRKFVNTQL